LLVGGLVACAGKDLRQRMDRWEEESLSDREAVRRAIEASFDRESDLSERLRQVEQDRDQLRAELGTLKAELNGLTALLDTMQQVPPQDPSPRRQRMVRNDVLAKYRQGLDNYRSRRYSKALTHFDVVLAMAPFGAWADNAQYWKGECYYGMGKFDQSLTEFTKVFAYRKTEKADDAQLKIARCYLALGDKTNALRSFQQLVDEYPKSEYIGTAKKEISYLRGF
jgi:tol-pal system protein YbgF